jgi:DDE domain
VACSRLRGRGSRCVGSIQAQQARRSETDAQASEEVAFVPERLVTDDLRSYCAAPRALGMEHLHERGRWRNNRAENSHQRTRRRERKMQRFKRSLCAEISLNPRRRLQHLQRPTPSHVSSIGPRASRRGVDYVARLLRLLQVSRTNPALRRLFIT